MRRSSLDRLKVAVAGLAAAGIIAAGANAQAVTLDAGVFALGNGDAANPIIVNVPNPGTGTRSGLFTDTINFDLGSFTHFNMTSEVSGNVTNFAVTIFQNFTDAEVSDPVSGDPRFPVAGYLGADTIFTNLALPDLGLSRDYHLHPGGIEVANNAGGYTLRLWGSYGPAPIPIPAAVYLFGAGIVGLAGLARRKRVV